MVKMIPDKTGRFAQRPFYRECELDNEGERQIQEFLQKRHGRIEYPVATDDLTVLIEQHGAELDSFADLSSYSDDVEGITEFFRDRGPKVSISKRISNIEWLENRLRTTLTHEFAHLKLHGPLWAERFAMGDLFDYGHNSNKTISKQGTILNVSKSDWMEWQASYFSGALLMPASRVRRIVSDYCDPRELRRDIDVSSQHAGHLVRMVMEQFAVSEEAARIRLLKLNLLTKGCEQLSLFDI